MGNPIASAIADPIASAMANPHAIAIARARMALHSPKNLLKSIDQLALDLWSLAVIINSRSLAKQRVRAANGLN